jgi:MFS family permease
MLLSQFGETPKEALNWRLLLAVLVFGMLGASRGLLHSSRNVGLRSLNQCPSGVDEGVISGTVVQKSFISSFGLKDPSLSESAQANLEANIVSMVQIACVGGSLAAFLLLDRIGRVRTLQCSCVLWIVGIVIVLTSSGNLGQLYAGRFICSSISIPET